MASPSSWPPGANFEPDLNREYYVIIGMGFSALVNHLMLRASSEEDRLGRHPVLHIGDTDPWTLYQPAPMGQWASIPTLPAFHHRPANPSPEDFLSSDEFSKVSTQQWADLARRYPFYALRGRVRSVQWVQNRFEVTCDGEPPLVIGAPRVDVCGGPGPSRRWDPQLVSDPALWREYNGGPASVTGWPRLLTGEGFLQASTTLPAAGSSVAVFGGGPTAAWCVERAENAGLHPLWVSRDPLHHAFLPTRRNDPLAQGPLTRTHKNGFRVVEGPVYPSGRNTRFAEGFDVVGVRVSGSAVELDFRPYHPIPNVRHVDGARNNLPPLASEQFDQVVVAIGHLQHPSEAGSWAAILDSLLQPAKRLKKHLMLDPQGRAVGLQSADGALRVLGAAALAHPDLAAVWRSPSTSSSLYMATLPEQARVDVGIALSAVTIAQANGYFGSRPMNNLNVASESELRSLFQQPVFQEMSSAWVEMRASRIHPFTMDELKAVQASGTDRY